VNVESVARQIAEEHDEPEWMLRIRLQAAELYGRLDEPKWLRGLDDFHVEDLILYNNPGVRPVTSWDELPEDIRKLYERLNLPDYEKEYLADARSREEPS